MPSGGIYYIGHKLFQPLLTRHQKGLADHKVLGVRFRKEAVQGLSYLNRVRGHFRQNHLQKVFS